ncbi:hypothetical protein [uncultured Pseudokineococcus sp.]|uniref:PulJ/GspJ family protein n=1 Tax=uncultured Pseudokineococcus sp. TaxID=1642928 RepID=UPI0026050643|nr:hypothetical protein [uncultured Pseudokineococcus sp.]
MTARPGAEPPSGGERVPGATRGDEGVSLVELLVAMGITSVLLVAIGAVLVADLKGVTDVTAKTTANAEVRLAADVIGRRLRVATPASQTTPAFLTTTPSEVSFTASVQDAVWAADPAQAAQDPPLTTVTYRYDAVRDCLTETLAPATGAPRTTCLLRGTSSGQALFTYYADTTGTVTTTTPAAVRSVGLAVSSSATGTGRTSTSTVTTLVTCPNTVPRA